MVRSPLTVGIFFVLAGYYLYYYGWLLWKSKHLEAADIEADSAAPHNDLRRRDGGRTRCAAWPLLLFI